jgi:hypothetical protein
MKRIHFFLFLLPLLPACKAFDKTENYPSYIRVQSYNFTADTINQGSKSNKITDVWLTVNNKSIGAFETPVNIPVLEEGKQTVVMQAGVKENGISTTRAPYPFYEPYTITADLQKLKIDTITPSYKYASYTKFGLIENFEGVTSGFQTESKNTAFFRITDDKDSAFEGNGALEIELNDSHNIFVCTSKSTFDVRQKPDIWMEMNYRTDVHFDVGLLSIGAGDVVQIPILTFNPHQEWNKIYLDLTDFIATDQLDRVYKIYFDVEPQNYSAGKIFIDNVKLLYRE